MSAIRFRHQRLDDRTCAPDSSVGREERIR
jgi:hypothetical protein